MSDRDSTHRRLDPQGRIERGRELTIEVDGEPVIAYEGETVAGALMGIGKRIFRSTARAMAPRGLYCGMGVCYECLMVIDGRPNQRACMTYVAPNLNVQTQRAWGHRRGSNGAP